MNIMNNFHSVSFRQRFSRFSRSERRDIKVESYLLRRPGRGEEGTTRTSHGGDSFVSWCVLRSTQDTRTSQLQKRAGGVVTRRITHSRDEIVPTAECRPMARVPCTFQIFETEHARIAWLKWVTKCWLAYSVYRATRNRGETSHGLILSSWRFASSLQS